MKFESLIGVAQLAVGAVAASGVSQVVRIGVSKLLSPEMKPVTKAMVTIGGAAMAGIGSSLAFDYIEKKFKDAQEGMTAVQTFVENVQNGVKEGLQEAKEQSEPGEAEVDDSTDDTKGK